MSDIPSALSELRQVNATFPYPDPVRQWKQGGGKVVGFLCLYTPEELIHAAGLLPLRITGDSREMELSSANAHLYLYTCSFVRTCLELAQQGDFSYLDGYVAAATCDPIRRLTDVWRQYLPVPVIQELTVPRKFTEVAHDLYLSQIKGLKEALEHHFGVTISNERLRNSTRLYNRTRALLRELYEMKKADHPPLSGAETLEVMNAACRMPREQYNQLLERLIAELRQSGRQVTGRYRLLVNGSMLNNPDFIRGIEDLGGLVVVDELCCGIRYWSDPVVENLPLLEALSTRYLNKFPCARMYPNKERFRRVLQLVRDYRVEGVVSQIIRYCAQYSRDKPLLREKLEAAHVPVLELDVECGMGATAQIRTRVQAFLEMLEGRKA